MSYHRPLVLTSILCVEGISGKAVPLQEIKNTPNQSSVHPSASQLEARSSWVVSCGYYLQSCPESRPAGISWRLDDRWPERSPAALTPWSPVPAAGPSLHKTEENTGLQHCCIHYRMIRSQEELDRISSCRETTLNICTFKSPFVTQQNSWSELRNS